MSVFEKKIALSSSDESHVLSTDWWSYIKMLEDPFYFQVIDLKIWMSFFFSIQTLIPPKSPFVPVANFSGPKNDVSDSVTR